MGFVNHLNPLPTGLPYLVNWYSRVYRLFILPGEEEVSRGASLRDGQRRQDTSSQQQQQQSDNVETHQQSFVTSGKFSFDLIRFKMA